MNAVRTATMLAVALAMLPGGAARAEGRVLTLDDALAKALAANPAIASSREALAAAGHKEEGSIAGYLPQAIAALSYRRATANSPISPWIDLSALPASASGGFKSMLSREEATSYNNYSASLSVTQTIWDFGRTMGANEAAKALRQAAVSDVATTVEGVRLALIQAYYGVLATGEVVSAAEETLRQMQKHLDQARIQADAGVRQRIDVTRAESDLASAELVLLRARNANQLARVNLDAVMGGQGATGFEVVRPPQPPLLEVDPAQAVRDAIARRPEARALRDRVQAAQAGVTAARSAWFPALQASAGVAWTGYELADMPYNWFAGASLTWNALSGVPAFAATQEAKANVRAMQASLAALENGIRSEVESTVLSYGEAVSRLVPAKALLESSRQTLALAEGRYEAGSGSIIEVTDAQAVWVQARAGVIGAEFDVQTARARLLKAMGEDGSAAAR